MTHKTIDSPRLSFLQEELNLGNQKALIEFWDEIDTKSTPLVEQINGDEDQVLVTFLWQAKEELENVVVASAIDGSNFEHKKMSHLPNSDLWYKSYQLPSNLRTTYRLSPNDSLVPFDKVENWGERIATWQPDPLNPQLYLFLKDDDDPDDKETVASVLALPKAPDQAVIAFRPEAPAGQLEMLRLKSELLDNERRVWIYTPPNYTKKNEPYGFLLLFDGWAYTEMVPTQTILDNLINDGLIPPLIAIMPDSPDQGARDLELPCYPPFADYLFQELLPWFRQNYHVSPDPTKSIVAGSSYGGLAAVFMGLRHSNIVGHVLSQSGSFWWKPEASVEHEWLTRQAALNEKANLTFYLEVGSLESGATPDDGPSQLVSNRHMRDVLQAKGYEVYYKEFAGGHDYLCWQGTLANGLISLVGGK